MASQRSAKKKHPNLQPYPRRDDYLAEDSLFPRPEKALTKHQLDHAIVAAFERCLTDKKGDRTELPTEPSELVNLCLTHLQERSDPILSPYFLSQCRIEEVFELDAIAHEMQRHRMRIGVFYQHLLIELMRKRFRTVSDGKREGDVEAEVETPGFAKGLRLFMSVKKSSDTVGGQDIGGVIRRLEGSAHEDKNLTRPYLCVVCFTTPQKGVVLPYEKGRSMKRTRDGQPYSPNCEVWGPGFVFPYVSGLEPEVIYKTALRKIGEYLPFNTLSYRETCGKLLAEQMKKLDLVDPQSNRIDPDKFQKFTSKRKINMEIESSSLGVDNDE